MQLHWPLSLLQPYIPPTIVYNALPYSYRSKYNARDCMHYVCAKLWKFCKSYGCTGRSTRFYIIVARPRMADQGSIWNTAIHFRCTSRQWPVVSDFVTRFGTLRESENSRTCENCTLFACNSRYLCQWAPAACPGFLLVSFGTVGALTSFEFSESGQPPLNTGRAEKSETQKFPPHPRHAHSFRILSLNSASRPPLFLPPYCCTSSCKYLTLWKFQSVALEPEILWKR